jgi:hypothetical protein
VTANFYLYGVGQNQNHHPQPVAAAMCKLSEGRVCESLLTWSAILNNLRSSALIRVHFLTLCAKVNYARALFLVCISLAGPLPELSDLLATPQTRQVRATKNHVPGAVLAAGLIDQRRITGHSFPIRFGRRRPTLVRITRELRNYF